MPDDDPITRADLTRELHYMQTQVEQHGFPGTRAVLAELERLSKENARLRQEAVAASREGRDLHAILEGLVETYKPEGIGVWLTASHRSFGGDSALDLIREGRADEVAAEVERLTSGAFS